ncbi:unnamed protein product [Urochloa decumbens]|uniref:Uncharacterized protein n=1 Tax=Urochloa decumbens TaxID=240449 RepID=A0ABC9G563_9POAL
MAAFAVKGLQQMTCAAALLSGKKYGSSNFSSNSYLCKYSPLQSIDGDRRHVKLKAQGSKRMAESGNHSYDGQPFEWVDFSNPFAPDIHIDLLNRMSVRPPLLERTKEVVADQRKRRLKAFRQRTIDFVDGLVKYISSHRENYKYFITASKENANIIMDQGFISSSARDEILSGLESIEKLIGEGIFKWINNVDSRTIIIEALIEIVGEPAIRLDATISHYVQQLTVLQIWCCDSIDKIITQIKGLQLELVLLAIRNEGLVLPCTRTCTKWILLGDLVLSKLEQLERNVSRLLSCKEKMNFTVKTTLPSGANIDDSKNRIDLAWLKIMALVNGDSSHHLVRPKSNSILPVLSKDSSSQIHNAIIGFGNTIVGDIAHDLSNLERDLASWLQWDMLMPNDTVTRSLLLMNKSMLDMDKFTAIRSSYSIYDPVKDSTERFLAVYKIIPEVLKAATDFVKSSSFNHENIQNFPPSSCFAPGLARVRATKEAEQDQNDDTRRKLLDWLQHLRPVRKV